MFLDVLFGTLLALYVFSIMFFIGMMLYEWEAIKKTLDDVFKQSYIQKWISVCIMFLGAPIIIGMFWMESISPPGID